MFDLQVNGYAGVDFNQNNLTADELHAACVALEEDGVESILATIITDQIDTMSHRLKSIRDFMEKDELAKKMIAGFHVEGPFINPEKGYVGAHPVPAVQKASVEAAKVLSDACGGLLKLLTLAPEQDPDFATTEWLVNQGVVVSAGHCNPTLEELGGAIDHGLSMFTHLGNGCPAQMHRHNNIVQRALSFSDKLWLCFIPDGVHVEFFALQNYLKAAGWEKTIFVTDAISAARLGPGRYTLAGWDLNIGEDLVARSPDGSHFVGSTVTYSRMKTEAVPALGLSDEIFHQLTSINPKKALGLI